MRSNSDIRTCVLIAGLALAAAAACADPGVTSCAPVPAAGAYSAGPGKNGGAGSRPDAAADSGTDSGSGKDAPGPCPTGFMCTDLSSLGATAVDQDGMPISHSCGMGGLVDCNDDDPKSTCSSMDNPICAHINVAGMDLVSCGQRCTP